MPTLNVTARPAGRPTTCRVFAGYSFQYLSRVARLGDVLDSTPASDRAARVTDFWVQSINFGVELRY